MYNGGQYLNVDIHTEVPVDDHNFIIVQKLVTGTLFFSCSDKFVFSSVVRMNLNASILSGRIFLTDIRFCNYR
jgi:hypothetical protein